jgi:MFS transporter, DHA2 family, multidrug resistance protein
LQLLYFACDYEILEVAGMSNEVGTVKAGRGRWLALGALVLSGLVLGLDATILVTALPTLSAKLGASTTELQWISAAFTLALAGLMLPAGVLADRLGRKRMMLVGVAAFGISSIVASQMTSATGLIWMRALMGASGAIILPLMLAILPTIFTEAERPRAVAIAGAATFLGLPLGPIVAGWLLNHFAWGSVFLINAPVAVIALIGVALFVPESRGVNAPRLDWIGALLEVVGVTGLIYGIIQQPQNGWTDPGVVIGVGGGAVLLGLFVAWELTRREPLVNLRLFRNPRFSVATAAFVVVGFTMTGLLFVLTPYLQLVQGNDPQGTGIRLLPMIGAVIVTALTSERLVARFGTRVVLAAGFAVLAAGLLLMSRLDAGTGYGLIAAALVVIGVGIALAMIPALGAILDALPEAEMGAGNGLTRTLQNVGASLGVAVMGTVLNNTYRGDLGPHLTGLPGAVRDAAEKSLAGATIVGHHLPAALAGPLVHAADAAYAGGMSEVLLVTVAMATVMAVVIALFMPARKAPAEASPALVEDAPVLAERMA